jgi:beta-glucosidase/6-phospho-beta-glucosidase/beta-galactosidase
LNNLEFRSFWQAGFESATQINRNAKRLDLVQMTQHDRWAALDYDRLARERILTAREGARWHVIEPQPGEFEFESVDRLLEAARSSGTELIWDLLHFGWPSWLDIFSSEWLDAFEQFVIRFLWCLQSWPGTLFVIPVNEISFLSWAAGEVGCIHPFCSGRGYELKQQLVRAFRRAAHIIRTLRPGSVILAADPIIHVVGASTEPAAAEEAARKTHAMFQGWDMLSGQLCPELGGGEDGFDVVGVNFYPQNQWIDGGRTLSRDEPGYRGLRAFLHELYDRYQRPLTISETGAQDEDRAAWLEYVAAEVTAAIRIGVPVLGICWYPILDHPGWDDDRYCRHGLWGYPTEAGERVIYYPLADALRRQPRTLL